ncbi:DUF2793 domain-containing protein [Hyphobacterium marinum]|uniref:DUF2793 domain-containing protein n=1 Tax=Hyphobacterium marinum TaxID=3116574 RepID=A0ABU7M0P4_9PROT|nr:DUF2793 domain-containing protein [Hyphobacterium sp. Y6023]MEE2567107.1 DUF2793 domain-containing protein [Hyphobacterium sp. Y6023]
MPIETTANLSLDYLMPAQAQKHVTVNESLRRLDALVQMSAASRSTTAQPATPEDGAVYILPDSATGSAWDSHPDGTLAYFRDGEWEMLEPGPGWRAYVADENRMLVFDGNTWIETASLATEFHNLARLGIGTGADAANPFSAKLNAALWTAQSSGEGGTGDLRYVLNKETAENVLSLLFQSGWSGRAEVGLVGDDNLGVKVSADGSAWLQALAIDRSTGRVSAGLGLDTAALNGGPLGGLRNTVINGGFDVWARGDSQSASGFGSADRFSFVSDDAGFAVSREALDPGEINAPLSSFVRIDKPNAGSFAYFQQRIESVCALENTDVTLSFWARSANGSAINDIGLYQDFGSGGSAKVFNTFDTSIALTTDWQRISRTLELPSIAGKTTGAGNNLQLFFNLFPVAAASGSIDIAGIQLERGARMTPFESRPLALETALCRRYFQTLTAQSENGSRHVALAGLRAAPTLSLSAGSASAATADGFELSHTSATAITIEADAEI